MAFKKHSKLSLILILSTLLITSCSIIGGKHKYTTVKRVVPKNKNRYYNPKKDKHKSRTKRVKALG